MAVETIQALMVGEDLGTEPRPGQHPEQQRAAWLEACAQGGGETEAGQERVARSVVIKEGPHEVDPQGRQQEREDDARPEQQPRQQQQPSQRGGQRSGEREELEVGQPDRSGRMKRRGCLELPLGQEETQAAQSRPAVSQEEHHRREQPQLRTPGAG